MHHYLYKTINLINSKYYIGVHSTNDLSDGYIGTGKLLRWAIKKYGKENFKNEVIIFFALNPDGLLQVLDYHTHHPQGLL